MEFELGASRTWEGAALADPNLEPGAKYVILALAQFTSSVGRMIWPSKGELCDMMGVNNNQLTKALKGAREAGYLRFVRSTDGGDNAYIPEMPPDSATLIPSDGLRRSGVTHKLPEGGDFVENVLTALRIDEKILEVQASIEAHKHKESECPEPATPPVSPPQASSEAPAATERTNGRTRKVKW